MIKNYLKIALRNLAKNQSFTFINVFGLVFGISCFAFISLWIWDEIRVDKFHVNRSNIYQVFGDINSGGNHIIRNSAPSSLVEPIIDQFHEVSKIARVFPAKVVFGMDQVKYSEVGIYADSSFLNIFSFPLEEGRLENIFSNTNSVVISAELAQKLFPGERALGQQIDLIQNEKQSYVITGVLERIPKYSSLQFDFVLSYDQFETKFRPWWGKENKASYSNYNVNVYAELNPEADVKDFDAKLNGFIRNNYDAESKDELFIFPFEEVYLHADFSEGRTPTGRIQYVKILFAIGLFVLIIACINFVNLSTAIASKRAKEVRLRKIAGASRWQLMSQFLAESTLISVVSLIIAMTLVELLLPMFNLLTHKFITIPFSNFQFLGLLVCGAIVLGILAGSYPAFFLSSFESSKAIRSSQSSNPGWVGIRKGLVIVQFTLAIIFIVFTNVVFNQIDFIQNKELGIRKKDIIQHSLRSVKDKRTSYKNDLLNIPGVQSVSFTEQDPYGTSNRNAGVSWTGKGENEVVFFNVIQVDEDFLKTFELDLLEGQDFSLSNSTERWQFIINQTAAKAMMIDDPVGHEMIVWGNEGTVTGVVKDYHHQSLADPIEPLVIVRNPDETYNAFISFEALHPRDLLEAIEITYLKYEQDYVFDYTFVNDRYQSSFSDVITVGRLAGIFAFAAILISCLGLFGLSAFVAAQRTKEIGIRKVLGAQELSLLILFSADFVKYVIISFVIASPIAWYYAADWLATYAFHIKLGFVPFLAAGFTAIFIALITVSYNTMRATNVNPVDTLKEG